MENLNYDHDNFCVEFAWYYKIKCPTRLIYIINAMLFWFAIRDVEWKLNRKNNKTKVQMNYSIKEAIFFHYFVAFVVLKWLKNRQVYGE